MGKDVAHLKVIVNADTRIEHDLAYLESLRADPRLASPTDEQWEAVLDISALQLGKDTAYSASEAAIGVEELIKAGYSLQEGLRRAAEAALDFERQMREREEADE